MKKMIFALLFGAATLGAGFASAETRAVKANTKTIVSYYYIRAVIACEVRAPEKYAIDREPAHGKIELSIRAVTLNKNARECAGGKGRALVVSYTPDRNYRGPDSFVLRGWYQQYVSSVLPTSEAWRVDVNVE